MRAKIRLKYGKLLVRTVSLALTSGTNTSTLKVNLNGKMIPSRFNVLDGKIRISLDSDAVIGEGGQLDILIG
jgi:hypothetical protein